MPSASNLLPALGHAVSGAGGTAVSTIATYPLDLVNTRLKVQRQLTGAGTGAGTDQPYYDGVLDALRSVYAREGGLRALYAGLGADVAKSVLDSFLFFLFYSWFRARARVRTGVRRRRLGAVEELAVGAAAGACSRALTTPIANVVARKQTAALTGGGGVAGEKVDGADAGALEMVRRIWREEGVAGLWAGYSASLVLTLNPSITFFLDESLRSGLAGGDGDEDGPVTAAGTFLVAAVSKAVATAVTYPFQVAKARAQVKGADVEPEPEEQARKYTPEPSSGGATARSARAIRHLVDDSIFAAILRIARTEGAGALYAGLGGEVLRAFFGHGTTMLAKDAIHRLVVQLYFFVVAAARRLPGGREALLRRSRAVADRARSGLARTRREIEGSGAVRSAQGRVREASEKVRGGIAEGSRQLQDTEAVKMVGSTARDLTERVRSGLAEGTRQLQDTEAAKVVSSTARDVTERVRSGVAGGARQLQDNETRKTVESKVRDTLDDGQSVVVNMLGGSQRTVKK